MMGSKLEIRGLTQGQLDGVIDGVMAARESIDLTIRPPRNTSWSDQTYTFEVQDGDGNVLATCNPTVADTGYLTATLDANTTELVNHFTGNPGETKAVWLILWGSTANDLYLQKEDTAYYNSYAGTDPTSVINLDPSGEDDGTIAQILSGVWQKVTRGAWVGGGIHGADNDATPADTDQFGQADTNGNLASTTWGTIKSLLGAIFCKQSNNLSDVGSASNARSNLGLGSMATEDNVTEGDFSFSDNTTADASTTKHGLLPKADKNKLDGIETGATANQTESEIQTAVNNDDDHGSTASHNYASSPGDVGLGNVPNEDATDMDNWDQKGATDGQATLWNDANSTWEPGDVAATPGGSDTQLQFNDSGSFGGSADLVFNNTTSQLTGGLGSGGQKSLSANLDQADTLIKRDVDGGSSYSEAGAVLTLQRDVTNVTAENGRFLSCKSGAGDVLTNINADGYYGYNCDPVSAIHLFTPGGGDPQTLLFDIGEYSSVKQAIGRIDFKTQETTGGPNVVGRIEGVETNHNSARGGFVFYGGDSGTLNQALAVGESGQVGIGNIDTFNLIRLEYPLVVKNDGLVSVMAAGTGGGAGIGFNGDHATKPAQQSISTVNMDNFGRADLMFLLRDPDSDSYNEVDSNDEVMRITKTGNVGIGINPNAKLDVLRQSTLAANFDNDEGFLERDIDGASSYSEAGSVLALRRNITNVTSENGNFLELQNAAGSVLTKFDKAGLLSFPNATMGDSTKDPTADAPTDWIETAIGGTTYYIPVYAA